MKFVTYILVGITLAMQSASAATNLTASSYNFNENDNLVAWCFQGENGHGFKSNHNWNINGGNSSISWMAEMVLELCFILRPYSI